MTTTAGVHVATVRQFNPVSGVATVVVPGLYGDLPIEAVPFVSSPSEVVNLPALSPGDSVLAFYDGGNPMAPLRWYLAGVGISEGGGPGGADEVWIGPSPPVSGPYEIWVDTSS